MTITDPSPAPVTTMRHQKNLGLVGRAVHAHLVRLQRQFLDDRPEAVAKVARIRRGAGRGPGDLPDLWGITGVEYLELDDRSEKWAEGAEAALHTAVTLWALHQQSHRDAGMHAPGIQLGTAVRRLMPGDEVDEPIRRRFVRIGTASSVDVLALRLRDIVQLLRRAAVPLDYGILADQIHSWQDPARRAGVRRAWGRSFHFLQTAPGHDRPADAPTNDATPDTTSEKDAQ